MSSIIYYPIDLVHQIYSSTYNFLSDWYSYYVLRRPQPLRLTYNRCFGCNSQHILDINASLNSIKRNYCYDCYHKIMNRVMNNIIDTII